MNILSALTDKITYFKEKRFLDRMYVQQHGRKMNWSHPTRFTEKIQLVKISKETEKLSTYVDKYQVRSYIEEQIGSQYLTKLIGVWDDPHQIDFEQLPNSFVLKVTHGSGWNILCPDKSALNKDEAVAKLSGWLAENYYESYGKEHQYNIANPRVICEEYLETKDKDLYDYKFYCFHGEPKFVNVVRDRSGPTQKSWYEIPWKKSELQPWQASGDLDVDCPANFAEMMEIARKLSKPFDQVRVDLYNVSGKILFGELTFTCSSGLKPFVPDRYDELFGSLW